MPWHEVVFTDEVQNCLQCDYSVTAGAYLVFFENTEDPGHAPAMVRQLYHLLFAGGCFYHERGARERALWCLGHGAWALASTDTIPALPEHLTEYVRERASGIFDSLPGYCKRPGTEFVVRPPVGPLSLGIKLIEYAEGPDGGEIKKERKTSLRYWAVGVRLKTAPARIKKRD